LCKLYRVAYKIEENLLDFIGITKYNFWNIFLYDQNKLETFKLCQKPLIFKKLNQIVSQIKELVVKLETIHLDVWKLFYLIRHT
jgi:hypothetical protein